MSHESSNSSKMEASYPTESTNNGEYSAPDAPDSEQEEQEQGNVVGPIAGAEPDYATGLRLLLIMFTIFLSTILAALEIGIIATAIPGITDEFHRLDDVGWYGSATFLLAGASSPMWGKIYKYLNVKFAYLASVALYLVGSLVAAATPNSEAVISSSSTWWPTLRKSHPVLIGSWMGVFMISTILGPVIGGAFTSAVTWLWCLWINLPLGVPIIALVLLFLQMPRHVKPAPATWNEIILQLDLPGFSLLLASLVCLTFALQWGGQTKVWDDGSVIATLILWILLVIVFIGVEWLQGGRAMIPLKLMKPRMTWTNALYCFISNAALFVVIFYLPIYFQFIHGQSAITSGVNTLPFLAFFAVGSLVSGVIVGKTRYLQPYQLISALLMTAGMAFFYTLEVDSSQARYIGPQVLFGFALGLGNQVPMTAVQGFSKPGDVASSTGIMLMCQSISGAYFLVVAQSIFANRMLQTLLTTAPNIDAVKVINTGASEIQTVFSGAADLPAVLGAYMVGVQDTFAIAMVGSALAVVLSLVIPFRRLPNHDSKKTEDKVPTVEA
ncbi:putative MFS transporter [Pseudomassariella vexata]|uniref:Putative MFS transporter n=1 Tax=Pseudomassariella vexata TaxID=1141098 RepID=A0A1Y2DXC4_9PEZI|nr:putative MFS transporter [Pseudomassariella vexata]ORY63942.1 putative MFS transporter [Pseudomassariella vexata]